MFKEIFSKCDTDKVNTFYEYAYDDTFLPIREDIKLLFEIGVCRGGSVRGFRDYFPNALIVGIDINPRCFFQEDRINIEIGNATQKDFINNILLKYGEPDVVVDDGSHMRSDIKTTFSLLYERTKRVYVIEDLGTQFRGFQNGFYLNDNIPAQSVVHQKIEELLYSKERKIKSVKIFHSICLISK
jgi:hypothetical protein